MEYSCTVQYSICSVMTRDGGKWWSKDHHLVVIKMPKNVERNFQYFLLNDDF